MKEEEKIGGREERKHARAAGCKCGDVSGYVSCADRVANLGLYIHVAAYPCRCLAWPLYFPPVPGDFVGSRASLAVIIPSVLWKTRRLIAICLVAGGTR